ncbi:MAG: sigma-70 family RNA polymerase sigma factor [Lachnospiraceae bacterium]|nr:sigma-70 family RNA polymerase sigma factor [Lachnospiraceae bacterium]
MDKLMFTEQVLAAEKQLYGTAKSILRNDADCADAVQSAILAAYAKLHTLRADEFFRTWLTRILINECYQIRRMQMREIPDDPQEGEYHSFRLETNEYGEPGQEMEHSDVYESLMQLKENYRMPVVLHYIEGYSVKETADILKLSENAVKQRLLRGRRELRKLLEE